MTAQLTSARWLLLTAVDPATECATGCSPNTSPFSIVGTARSGLAASGCALVVRQGSPQEQLAIGDVWDDVAQAAASTRGGIPAAARSTAHPQDTSEDFPDTAAELPVRFDTPGVQ